MSLMPNVNPSILRWARETAGLTPEEAVQKLDINDARGVAASDRLVALESGPIAAIWFEEVRRHAGTDAAHIYGGLMATLTSWAELRGVPYQGVPVGTIKRHATGKGNAPKEAMIAAARARGFSPADDNEADAIAILHWAIETNGGLG